MNQFTDRNTTQVLGVASRIDDGGESRHKISEECYKFLRDSFNQNLANTSSTCTDSNKAQIFNSILKEASHCVFKKNAVNESLLKTTFLSKKFE